MTVQDLPHILAAINAATIVALALGFGFARKQDRASHKKTMITALALSAAFLAIYVFYKLNSGFARFGGEGLVRPIYFTILIAHVIGAFAITPLVPLAAWKALSGNIEGHRKMVRYTWPLWMYVAVSGVVVYVMAVHLYPWTGPSETGLLISGFHDA
ncbi:MAG: DUF420 domain-containing protein [Magnetovibrionaceae bacterium]